MPRIFLGSDHRGFVAKQRILATLSQSEWAENYEIVDLGPETMRPDDDFNDYAIAVSRAVRETEGSRGILICGSAHGISMQANRFKGIRAICGYLNSFVSDVFITTPMSSVFRLILWMIKILTKQLICSFAVISYRRSVIFDVIVV